VKQEPLGELLSRQIAAADLVGIDRLHGTALACPDDHNNTDHEQKKGDFQ